MSWSNRQKRRVHEYARYAGMSGGEYRFVLCKHTGAFTSTEPSLSQQQWELVMTELEAALEERVVSGVVSLPSRKAVGNLRYWRNRFPEAGEMTSRQRHSLEKLWEELKPYLEPEQRTDAYLTGIARKVCGHAIEDVWKSGSWMASCLIDALQDRLRYVRRSAVPPKYAKAI